MSDEAKAPSPWRAVYLALYYSAIIAVIILLHSQSSFSTPKFIYQGF